MIALCTSIAQFFDENASVVNGMKPDDATVKNIIQQFAAKFQMLL
jgi:hypothetical protein